MAPQLPLDVLAVIVFFCEHETFAVLRLTCSAFRHYAESRLAKHVVISSLAYEDIHLTDKSTSLAKIVPGSFLRLETLRGF
jgi:hypothetical protein